MLYSKPLFIKAKFAMQVVAKNLYNQDAGRTAVQFGALDNRCEY